MENSPHFDKTVIDLGKKILSQFHKGEDRGILTSWMSHHVAALMAQAERGGDLATVKEIRKECVDTILKLWSHRNNLSDGSRPFEHAELAVKTLSKLAPEYMGNFYFERSKLPTPMPKEESIDAGTWLKFAEDFDKNARVFVRFCLSQSFSTSATELRQWVETSQEIGDDSTEDMEIVRMLIERTSDDELEEIANPEIVKSEKVLDQLDKIIANFVGIREAIALSVGSDGAKLTGEPT